MPKKKDKRIYENAGQPPVFSKPKDLQKAIQDYFDNVPTREIIVGSDVINAPVITITGLCLHLGFASRQSFYDYENRDKFSYTIKRARMMIEHEYEAQLKNGNTTGALFALKNFGWIDKTVQEVDVRVSQEEWLDNLD